MRKSASLLKSLLAVLLLFLLSYPSFGQVQTVSGTVKDPEKNTPLVGAGIKVSGTNTSTQTDEKGNFTIRAAKGQTLVISHVGYATQQVAVDGSAVTVQLKSIIAQQDEVIVVAMDIKRKPRELGYSVQQVSGKEIQETQRENFINSLQGRVAGLMITPTTGEAGASSSINLRGFNSSGVNQPLFVVDGIIIDNQTIDENSNSGSGLGLASDRPNRTSDYTNRIADINPNDIETVTVLKGPEATALYGSQASSGAIVITTKKPSMNGKTSIAYDDNFRMQRMNRFPQMINSFSPGNSGGPSGSTFVDFGPAYPANTKMYDNLHDFFKTGFAQTHNLSVNFGKKDVGFKFSGSYFNEDGVVPNNTFERYNFKLSNYTKIGKYIDITPSIAYINSTNDKPLRGGGGYLLDLFAWPSTNDARHYEDKNGNRIFALPGADPSVESDNPFFSVNKNKGRDVTNRLIASLSLDIHPFSWLTVSGRFGFDTYHTNGYQLYNNQSSVSISDGGLGSKAAYLWKGFLDNYWRKYAGYNHTIYVTAKKDFGGFSTRIMVGTMWQDYETRMFAISGSNLLDSTRTDSSNITANKQLLLRNYYNQYNESILKEMAYFGEVGIGYKNVAFLSYTHRFEAASVFPAKNRNYNYPGASLSVIVSDIFPHMKSQAFNYFKLRGSLAGTARLPDPYLNQSVFVNNSASSPVPAFSYGFYNNNADLQPERQRTYEVGTEIHLLNNRVSIDAAYYNTYCYNQISQAARASYGTGFVLNTQNAASLRNQGLEIMLDVNPIKKGNWDWDIRFNFNHTWSKVLTLPESIGLLNDYYNSDNSILNARGGFVRGHSTTTLTGWNYARNNAGKILINPTTGLPVVNQTFMPIGDRNPVFTLGTLNNIRYKNWNLSFLWDLKMGGDIFNGTDLYLTTIGRSQRTADRLQARVVNGVLNDGLQNSANPTKNTIQIIPYYNSTNYYGESTGMPDEEFVQHHVNWLRLRDVTLNYLLPQKVTNKIRGLKALSVFATANDLILFTNYGGADPAVSATSAATRGVGSFGYDYGNLPTPQQLNFGLRANF